MQAATRCSDVVSDALLKTGYLGGMLAATLPMCTTMLQCHESMPQCMMLCMLHELHVFANDVPIVHASAWDMVAARAKKAVVC